VLHAVTPEVKHPRVTLAAAPEAAPQARSTPTGELSLDGYALRDEGDRRFTLPPLSLAPRQVC
jgi:hypothetical protein